MRRSSLARAVAVALLVAAGSVGPPAVCAAADATIGDVTIGLAGKYKLGYWTPVSVRVTAGQQPLSARLDVLTRDGDGLHVRYTAVDQPLEIAAGQTATVQRYVKFGRLGSGLVVELSTDAGLVARKRVKAGELPAPLLSDAELMVTLGGDIGVDQLQRPGGQGSRELATARIEDARQLADAWYGYEGLDTLIVTTADNPLLDEVSPAQFEAIRKWVLMGGQLVLCLGTAGDQVLAPENVAAPRAQLAALVPGRFAGLVALRDVAAIENYAGGVERLEIPPGERLRMTRLVEVRGNRELTQLSVDGEHPLVVRNPLGFGQVVFVALDLDQPPLQGWAGRHRLVANVLYGDAANQQPYSRSRQAGQVAHTGYRDMVGQMRAALDQFSSVPFVAFSWVAVIILVYIVLIGPADYFLLKNVLRRMQLTWITFPVVALAFTLLALVLNAQLKSDRLLVNQVDLVDVDVDSGFVRGTMWAHVYSPRTRTYDVRMTPLGDLSPAAAALLSWQGLPGTGLGGLNTTGAAPSFERPYTITQPASTNAVRDLPISVASTTGLAGRWWAETRLQVPTQLTSDEDDLLHGDVVNPLSVELRDCQVLYSTWVYRLDDVYGTLAPGQTASIDRELPSDLEWSLTQRALSGTSTHTEPWNQQNLDVPRILKIMMFHGAAGGDNYTQLTHRYQGFVDLSDHLASGRAVLLGRVAAAGSEISIDGNVADGDAGQRWTYYRIVFPVQRDEG